MRVNLRDVFKVSTGLIGLLLCLLLGWVTIATPDESLSFVAYIGLMYGLVILQVATIEYN